MNLLHDDTELEEMTPFKQFCDEFGLDERYLDDFADVFGTLWHLVTETDNRRQYVSALTDDQKLKRLALAQKQLRAVRAVHKREDNARRKQYKENEAQRKAESVARGKGMKLFLKSRRIKKLKAA